MDRINILPPSQLGGPAQGLAAAPSLHDLGRVAEFGVPYLLAHILANISLLAAASAAALVSVDVTFSLDTSAYTAGDVLADVQAIAGALRAAGAVSKLTGIVLTDKDDQTAAAIDVVFLKSNTSIGTENSAPNISDANVGLEIIGIVTLAAADFIDVGGAKVATKVLADNPLEVYATAGTSIYVALICRGTPTQTASGITAKFNFRQE